MNTLIVGGLQFQIEQIIDYEIVPVMAGPDRLMNKHTAHFLLIFNPAVNAYLFSNPVAAVIGGNIGSPRPATRSIPKVMAATTFQAIQDFLMQPQQSLSILTDVGAQTQVTQPFISVVTQPFSGLAAQLNAVPPAAINSRIPTSDPGLGPFPLYARAMEWVGTKTFFVEFGVTFYTSVPAVLPAGKPVLLSNRFEVSTVLDQYYYTTRTVTGRAIFDVARLAILGQQPDYYRAYFPLLPETGFRRLGVQTRQSSDGSTVFYTVTDVQRPVQLSVAAANQNIAHIDAVLAYSDSSKGGIAIGIDTVSQIVSLVAGMKVAGGQIAGLGGPSAASASVGRWSAIGNLAGSTGMKLLSAAMQPYTLVATIYGKPRATRAQMLGAATTLVTMVQNLAGDPLLTGRLLPSMASANFTLFEKVLNIQYSCYSLYDPGQKVTDAFQLQESGLFKTQIWNPAWDSETSLQRENIASPEPSNSSNTRDVSYLQSLVSAAIQVPGTAPSRTANPTIPFIEPANVL